jgi:predicted GIY-YIG superfamily endonuclease
MKNIVYLITRTDGMQYVGITCQFNKRMSAHKKSKRFVQGIEKIEILEECDTYEEAELLESEYIKKYDTYYSGLNESIDGKGNHLAPKFTTRNYKFTEEQRKNMRKNHWSKKIKNTWTKPGRYSEEVKNQLSEKRKGISFSPRKIPRKEALIIIETYKNNSIEFDDDFIRQFVKVTHRDQVGKLPLEELKTPNGKHLNKIKLYAEFFCKQYGVTKEAIRRILTNGVAEDYEYTK